MKLLLLGGTGSLGRAITTHALARGHEVTCLARGNGTTVDGAVLMRADRDQDDALSVVSDRNWDAVIDLASQPVHARRAVRDLRAEHWVYVSSVSVYTRGDDPDRDELASTAEPLTSDRFTEISDYGAAKMACENIYRENSTSHTILRPGLIGGNEDETGRSGYYPWRFAHPTGDDVLVPDPSFPVALIDIEDLASWIIDCADRQHLGTFNAAGETTTLAEVLELSREVTGSAAVARVVSDEALEAFGVNPWMGGKSLPLWINERELRYAATANSAAARAHGLRLRPIRQTLAAALVYENSRSERPAGLSDEEERALRQSLQ